MHERHICYGISPEMVIQLGSLIWLQMAGILATAESLVLGLNMGLCGIRGSDAS